MGQAIAAFAQMNSRPATRMNFGYVLFFLSLLWLAAITLPHSVKLPSGCEVTVMGDVAMCVDN